MSYYPGAPPHGQPPYGAPPPQGYNQYPPPSTSPHPPHGQPYGHPQPPMNQYPQQPYGAPPPQGYPPQGYPPQQPQQWGPPQGYPPQPYGAPGAPPPGQYPPPQQHQAYGAPPPGHGAPPPHGQYGAPPAAGYGAPPAHYPAPAAGPPAPPTAGYDPNCWQHVPTDMNGPALECREAMKGFGTNEAKLIKALAKVPDAPHMAKLRHTYNDRLRRDLIKDIDSETSGYFRDGLIALVRGPLEQDCYLVHKALKGVGTKEELLDEVLCGRSNADINAIKQMYHKMYHRNLVNDVKDDLSMKTERMYDFILAAQRAEESAPVLPHQVEQDVQALHHAMEAKMGTDQVVVCQILCSRSDGQIRAINMAYQQKWHRGLDETLKKHFSGHMEDALRLIVARASDRFKSDADQLEASMKGMGTKDELLVNRVVRVHWDRNHLFQVKSAYRQFYKVDLSTRIKGETRGDYEKLMVALVEG